METLKEYWTEEFAPKTVDDMVLVADLKEKIKNQLASKTKFHALYAGRAGIGKTTLANIVARELNASVLFVPCGVEGTVATAQGKIKTFCESLDIDGKPKLVILDELDSASGTQDNSMQKVLRNIITDSSDTMFIGTCNYPEKVIEPLQSRLGGVRKLEFSAKDLFERLMFILNAKEVKYTKEALSLFVKNVLKVYYPDIRKIILELQNCCSTGTLVVSETVSVADSSFLDELIRKCKTEKNMLNLRQFYISNKSRISDYLTFSSEVFNSVLDSGLVSDRDTILKMSNIIYQMNLVIDREICFFSLMTLLNKVFSK
jgi:DNA polymerase III delta prime subunit